MTGISSWAGREGARKPWLAVSLLAVTLAAGIGSQAARAQPQIPSTFFGSVSIDGQPVPNGTEVRGFIDGRDCTQLADLRGAIRSGPVSAYAISVMHESQSPGCGAEGRLVAFRIGGRPAAQTALFKSGAQQVDLNAGAGNPAPLPTVVTPTVGGAGLAATATEIAKFTPKPPGTIPTDDVALPRSGDTPGAPGSNSSRDTADNSGGLSPLLMITVAVIALGLSGAVAGLVLSRRAPSRAGKDP